MSAIAALMFSFFPELAQGTDIPSRAIGLSNAVISVLSAAFGLGVSLPNVPYIATNVERVRGTIPPHGNGPAFQADVGELRERLIDGK